MTSDLHVTLREGMRHFAPREAASLISVQVAAPRPAIHAAKAWLLVASTTSPPPAVQISIPPGYPWELPARDPEQPKPWRLRMWARTEEVQA